MVKVNGKPQVQITWLVICFCFVVLFCFVFFVFLFFFNSPSKHQQPKCLKPYFIVSQPWSSSRKKPSREEREAQKQKKREEKKSREDEKRQKREEKKKRKDREKIDKFFQSRQKNISNYTYFCQPLESICDPTTLVPAFLDKCIEFVENTGESRNPSKSL